MAAIDSFLASWRVRAAGSACRSSRRAPSRSTRRTVPVRRARDSGPSTISTPPVSCRMRAGRWPTAPWPRGPAATAGSSAKRSNDSVGISVSIWTCRSDGYRSGTVTSCFMARRRCAAPREPHARDSAAARTRSAPTSKGYCRIFDAATATGVRRSRKSWSRFERCSRVPNAVVNASGRTVGRYG